MPSSELNARPAAHGEFKLEPTIDVINVEMKIKKNVKNVKDVEKIKKKRLLTLDKKTLPTFAMNPTIIFAH